MRMSVMAMVSMVVFAVSAAACTGEVDEEESAEEESALKGDPPAPIVAPPIEARVTSARDEVENGSKNGAQISVASTTGKQWRVVYSIKVPALAGNERLRVLGEVGISRCNRDDINGGSKNPNTPCLSLKKPGPYDYDPMLEAKLILAKHRSDIAGFDLAKVKDRCTEEIHHCPLTMSDERDTVDLPKGDRFVNLIVSAGHSDSRPPDIVEVEKGKGGLSVIRSRADAEANVLPPATVPIESPMLVQKAAASAAKKRVLVFQVPLAGIAAGNVIDVEGTMKTQLGNYSFNPLVGSHLVLTSENGGMWPITQNNGFNCDKHGKGAECTSKKAGAFVVPPGLPEELFVNYYAYAVRDQVAGGKYPVKVTGGKLEVVVRR